MNASSPSPGGHVPRSVSDLSARVRSRVASRMSGHGEPGAGGDLSTRVNTLEKQVAELSAAIDEERALHQRVADVVDVVTEILVPAAGRDDARMREALARLDTPHGSVGEETADDTGTAPPGGEDADPGPARPDQRPTRPPD